MDTSVSWIGELIAETGCDCDECHDRLEDHTCLAGRAELEWRTLSDECDAALARAKAAEARVAVLEAAIREHLEMLTEMASKFLHAATRRENA